MSFAARIKPYEPRKGQVARSYTHIGLNRRFVEGQIYRGLNESDAAVLRAIRQPKAGRGPLFDVGTPEEMEQILADEAAAKLGVSRAVAPLVVPPPQLVGPEPAARASFAVPVEQLEHTDLRGGAGNARVQHTQGALVAPSLATPSRSAPNRPNRPRQPGGASRGGK